ncbi:hypothetical protein DSO57_1001773 [Entomophthora muscae]|uniref:Uncharacterized protein n=1 Tax=Entomophthora muscae TaxID=34485 RepID=A0ACC2T8L5_9FUNG|nr:hypothetical protein DSO57_1001773 [Entomophthora muscae]
MLNKFQTKFQLDVIRFAWDTMADAEDQNFFIPNIQHGKFTIQPESGTRIKYSSKYL